MAINIGDNFSYQGKKYLDDRQSFKTLSELQNYNNVPEGFIAYCEENKKRYEYKDGAWAEYVVASSGGSSGGGTISEDVATKAYVDGLIETHTHEEYDIKFDDVRVGTATTEGLTALDFYANGEKVKSVQFSGGGGSGGGSPYISTELSENVLVQIGQNLELTIDYYAPSGGKGTLKVFINNVDSLTTSVVDGTNTISMSSDKLNKGTNQVVVYAIDRAGMMSNSLTFYVRYGSTDFTSDFDSSTPYDYGSTIRYYFTPTALDTSVALTFYMKINGSVQPGVECQSDTRSYFTFSNNITAGGHECECWVEDANGNRSEVKQFTLVVLSTNTLVVVSKTRSVTLEEGSQLALDYRVYKKNETTFKIKTYIDDNLVTSGTCGTSTTYYKTTSLQKGVHTIRIEAWDITETYTDSVSWTVTVTPSTYTLLEPIKAGSMFSATAQNRTNGDTNRDIWVGYDQDDNPVNAQLYNFSFNSESGWMDDQLLITGNSYVEIPVQPLANNAKYGFTLDVEFSAKPVGADDAEVLSLWNEAESCGIKITQEQVIMQSKSGNRCELYFTENENVSAIFVIDRNEKTAKIYLNGVMCSAFALSDYTIDDVSYLEDFTVTDNIYLGGRNTNGYSRFKNIRVYEIALTSNEILNNFMSNEKDKTKQIELVNFQKGEDLPTVTVYCDFSGLGKKDKRYCDIIYNSPDPSKYGESFALTGKYSQLQYQGTSSMQYPIKNYRLNPKNADGKVKIKLPFCQPESRFTLKADFMSSGHWQNTGLTKWINDNLYEYNENDEKSMNPAKWWAIQNGKNPDDYRECIYGFPCRLILVNDGNTPLNEGQQEPTPGNTKDMGVFNFNLDKDCENSLGFKIPAFPNAISMEVTANSDTSAGAFMSKDLPDDQQLAYLQESFELRYGNEAVPGWGFMGMEVNGQWSTEHSLKALIDWVDKSTDEEFVSQFEEHFHKDYTFRYYLLVMVLGMVDNLGKNMMLDSYDGKIWMPRFYDCDTICSYDNSGAIKFDVDIEMAQGYWNTSSSRLWTRIRDLFHDELIAKYNQMRKKGLNYESLMSVFYDEQIAKIPQKYYNLDADVKYLPYADEYLGKAHGDGYEHLKRWLKNRLIFTDTLYDYTPSYTNDMITFRANTTELMTITIETYTPVYQHLSWYNGNMEKGKIAKGKKFTFTGYAQAATDQEVLIYGGSNIKRITGISSMNPDSMLIGNATRLVELDVSGSPLLTDINSNKANLTAHTYLTKLDISDCPNLVGSLRLNFSPLIQEINAMNTGITDLQLPSSIRNLKSLKVPGALTNLTLNDASSLETLMFDGVNHLQLVSMTNCNALKNVVNFDMTQVPNVTLNNSYDVEELYMSKTTNLSLINMKNIKRLVYLPNTEYENFNLTTLRNSSNYTISAVNCPSLKTFIVTAPQRKSYKKDTLVHDVRPDMVFCSNILDISNTKITDLYLYCTTDVYQLRLPATLNNFICDSTFDIDMKHITEADFDFIHHDLIEAYTNPDNYFRYVDSISHDIVPTASDGSLIFSMYAPDLNSVEPDLYEWNLYGLRFEEFYTYAMNNNIKLTSDQITMASRYPNYGITINNAVIEPTRYPTMFYPILVNAKSPVIGEIDYKYYIGDDLSYAMAYANKNEVNIIIPTSVIINAAYTHKIDYESEYTYFHPNTIMVYTSLTSGVRPTFNTEFTRYTVNETQNGDGTYTTTIASTITGDAPKSISFSGATNLYSVEYINTSKITNMNSMFKNCSSLIYLDVSGWDTSKVTDMSDIFYNCSGLTSLDLSGWDTSLITNMSNMFAGCSSLSSLDISGWSTSRVTAMNDMFDGCSLLTSLDLSSFNTSLVTTTSDMFKDCSSLTSLDLSSWNTSKVTNMTTMFKGCSSLSSLNLSGWSTSRVSNMIGMFQNCSSLTSLDLSSFNTLRVSNMAGMFENCSSLTSLDLSSFNTSNVTNMGSMFRNCSRLTSLILSNFNTSLVTDMNNMFSNCSSLTSLDLRSFNTSSVTDTTSMFQDCDNLTSIKWTNWLKSVDLSYTILTSECIKDLVKNLGKTVSEQTLTLNNTLAGYLTKMDMMYATSKGWVITPDAVGIRYANVASSTDLSGVTDATYKICIVELTESNKYTRLNDTVNAYTACNEVYIYDDGSVTDLSHLLHQNNKTAKSKITIFGFIDGYFINNIKTNHMFADHGNLIALDLSGLNTSSVTDMDSMFYGCSKLTSLDVSGFDTSKVTNMAAMFYGCKELTSLNLSGWDTSSVTNMGAMFQNCPKLTSLDLSGLNTSKVTTMISMFYGCSGLTSLDLSNWNTSNVGDMSSIFRGCKKLTSLNISHFNTSKVIYIGSAFNECSGLASLDVSNWDTSKITDLNNMFTGCSSLTSLDLSGWDTSSVINMSSMFNKCSNLTSLIVSHWNTSKVNSMTYMFGDCSRLTTLDLSTFVTSETVNTSDMFKNCTGLTDLKWVNWKPTVSLSNSTKLTAECLKNLLTNLATVTTKPTLTLGTTNLNKITTSDILKAQFKGWIIDGSNITAIFATDEVIENSTVTECAIQLTSDNTSTRIADVLNAYTACSKIYLFDDGTVTNLGECIKTANDNTTTNKPKQVEFMQGYFKNVNDVDGLCEGVSSLTYLNLGDIISNKITSLNRLCTNCRALKTIVIPIIDTSSVTIMDRVFDGCQSLVSIDLRGWDTSNVTSMYAMFGGCSSLTSLDVSNFNTSKVINMVYMFTGCQSLTSLDLSHFNTSAVNNMSYMFQNCSKLTSLDITSFDTSSVNNMGAMFQGCSSLTSLDLNHFNTSNVTNMTSMFKDCKSLVSPPITTFGNNINYSGMYYECISLNTVPTLSINGPCNLYRLFALCKNMPDNITFDWKTDEKVNVAGMFVDGKYLTSLYGVNLTSCGETLFTGFFFGGIGPGPYDILKNLTCTGILSYSMNISAYTGLTKESLMEVINRLCNNGDGLTLTIGTTNIAKLTEEEISSITTKGWTLA